MRKLLRGSGHHLLPVPVAQVVAKKRKLSEEGNFQGDGLDVGNEVIDEIESLIKKLPHRLVAPLYWRI